MTHRLGTNILQFRMLCFTWKFLTSGPWAVRSGSNGWKWTRTQELQLIHSHWPLHLSIERWSIASRRWEIDRSASGECFLDGGAWQFQGYDEIRSLNGCLTGLHKVLCSAGETACKGRHYFDLGSDGGFVIPVRMRMHFERLVELVRKTTAHSSLHRRQHLQFLSETNIVNNSQQPGNEYGRAVRQ